MMNNDLSNCGGNTIAFRVEDFLVTRNLRLLNRIKRDTYIFNENVLKAMNYTYRNTEFSVELVMEKSYFSKKLENKLDTLPFNRITLIKSPVEITNRLLNGEFSYYVDNDVLRCNSINSRYAITLDTCFSIIRGLKI